MIATEILTAVDDTIGYIVVPRDSNVRAGVQYATGGLGTLVLEGTLNDINYDSIGLTPIGGGAVVASATAAGQWYADISQFSRVRLRKSVAGGGSVTASLSISAD